MPGKEDAIDRMSLAKRDAKRRMDEAVAAVIALCWDYRSLDFSFSGHIALQREVNRILAGMSDGILSDSERLSALALSDAGLEYYEAAAIDYAKGEINGEDVLARLDRQADHLKDLLAGWLVVAAFAKFSREETIWNFWAYIGNAGASRDWVKAGLKTPGWGKGFQLNILDGVTLIGQDMINKAFQFARIESFKEEGAIGYRTIRQSGFNCPYCDEMCTKVYPLDELVLPYHPRCVCKAVPVFIDEI